MDLKKSISKKLNTGKPVDFEKIISEIEQYDVVSFDIFDTLLKRNVNKPTDVFRYIEEKFKISNFKQKRVIAEQKAREKNKKSEITIKDIYAEMEDNMLQVELQVESELLRVNDDMLPVYEWCVKNKLVVLVSDMYLPEEFIVDILQREGIVGYKKLYLSSTIKKKKSDGGLFKYVVNELGSDSMFVHIGDSFKSDYLMPRRLGLKSIHIPTYTPKSLFHLEENSIDEIIINAFLDNTSLVETDDYYRFGYEKFGMFLWGYTRWLHDSIVKEGIKEIYFFSRDGLIMKKAFDSIYSDIKTHYLEVSRRSLRVPILWKNLSFEHVLNMISPSKLISLNTIFDGVGLDIHGYKEIIKKYGFNEKSSFDRNKIMDNESLNRLYEELKPEINKVSKSEYDVLVKYIHQENIQGKFAIVDIGWSGGMQRYLHETLSNLKIEHKIKGYYIGVADYYKRNTAVVSDLDLNGYLFDFSHNQNDDDKRRPFVGLFETLFLEQDGSVKNYVELNGVIRSNRLPYEYVENNKPTYEYSCVKKIQRGALDFVQKFGEQDINIASDKLFSGIEHTGLCPTSKELKLFADFRFFDEGEVQYLAKPKKAFCYIIKPSTLKKDFLQSRWKIGFMKRLIVLPLPYERLYKIMLKYK